MLKGKHILDKSSAVLCDMFYLYVQIFIIRLYLHQIIFVLIPNHIWLHNQLESKLDFDSVIVIRKFPCSGIIYFYMFDICYRLHCGDIYSNYHDMYVCLNMIECIDE